MDRAPAAALGLVTSILVSSGCVAIHPSTVAYRRPADAATKVELLFGHCRNDRVLATDQIVGIEVRVTEATPTTSGPEPTTIPTLVPGPRRTPITIWSIRSDTPRRLDSLRVGEVPAGFAETVPLTVPIPNAISIVVSAVDGNTTSSDSAEINVSELPDDPTLLYFDDRITTVNDFRASVRQLDDCRPPSPSFVGSAGNFFAVAALAVIAAVVVSIAAAVLGLAFVSWVARRYRSRRSGPNRGSDGKPTPEVTDRP